MTVAAGSGVRVFVTTAVWIVIVAAAAFVGSRFMPGAWYADLAKPSFTPPGWLFGPVWSLLYLMMAIAASVVWRRTGWSTAIALFIVQLVLNALWSYFFFGRHDITVALIDIVILWLAIAATIAAFARVKEFAAWLMVPYLVWVSFATVLNAAIWRLNG